MDLALTLGVILLVFFLFFLVLRFIKRWSEKNDSMTGDFGDRFRLWKRPERED